MLVDHAGYMVSYRRRRFLCDDLARKYLRESFRYVRSELPFDIVAIVLTPDHLHAIWKLPEDDADFSKRWGRIKKGFTDRWLGSGGRAAPVSPSRQRHRERGVWQRRFWEHTIRDEADFRRHVDYIHFNPVKHGLAGCPHAWPWSTFSRWVEAGVYKSDWCCACGGKQVQPPDFADLDETAME
jgi:putative transposase